MWGGWVGLPQQRLERGDGGSCRRAGWRPQGGCAGGIARKAPGATGRECARGQGAKSSEASGKPDLDL